jgi:hypothetical protein
MFHEANLQLTHAAKQDVLRRMDTIMSKPGYHKNPLGTKGECDYCFRGIRRIGGASLIRAFTSNVRTFVFDAKGKGTNGEPMRLKVPMRIQRADVPVVLMRLL